MAQSRMAVITFLDGSDGYPDNSLPSGPQYPSQGPVWGGGHPSHPISGGGARPDQGLPGMPGYPVHLPVFPFDPTKPDNSLPGEGQGGSTLPIRPGAKFVVKWLACHGFILVPDNSLPSGGERPDQGLPEYPEPK